MDAMSEAAATENMNKFVPSSDLIQEEECDTLLIYLPGFTKEQLRVQLTRAGVLKISGAKSIGENQWSSFQKDFPVSQNCDTNGINAKFESGILYVRQPKLIVPADQEKPQKVQPSETPKPQDPQPQTSQKLPQEQAEATPVDDEHKQKSDKKPEAKAEEKSRMEGAKKDERKREKGSDHKRASVSSQVEGDNKLKVAKLKMARKMRTMVLAVVLALALGMYISKYMVWFSKKTES